MVNHEYIKDMLRRFEQANKDIIAFSVYDGESIKDISYNQFAEDILRAVAYFKENGISGQHIALISPNSCEWIVAYFGVVLSGNVAVLLNPALPKEVLQDQCQTADVSIVCSEKACCENFGEMLGKRIVVFEDLKNSAPLTMDDICPLDQDATISLLFTSGTTGKSKAVEMTSRNLKHSIASMDEMFAAGNMDCAISTVPLYHIAGIRGGIAMLYHYKKLCFGRGLMYLIKDMPVFNPTYILLVPVMIENIIKLLKYAGNEEMRKNFIGSRLKRICVAGAALKRESALYLMDLGFVLDNAYAMTETIGDGMWHIMDRDHVNSIGKAGSQIQGRIDRGEIVIKGPSVMKGYYKDPQETAKVIEDGWIRTGDMGYCDENGYFYLTGRKKNVIILSNGENVNPEEIEAKFDECAAIVESMVYSDGKGICADVYAENEEQAAAFIAQYNVSMPKYRQVYKVNYSAGPLERTATGKIKRKENK